MPQAESSGVSRKRKERDTETSTPDYANKSSRTGKTTVYDKAFEQNLVDNGVFPEGYEDEEEPQNLADINSTLLRSRASLSPSRFDRDAHLEFKRRNRNASTEDDVTATVLPMIIGEAKIPGSRNVEFNHLAPLTDGTISKDKPDYYEGSCPADLKKGVRDKFGEYIVPSTDTSRLCLPNFFIEVKGPRGTSDVLKLQACYAGAIGARAMHKLQSYVDDVTALNNNAYTTTWAFDSGTGTLIAYATYPTRSQDPERAVDYRMTQLNGWNMTGNPDTFRQGASAFRNARDWAQERRRELIYAANKKSMTVSPAHTSTSEDSAEIASSQTITERSPGSETPQTRVSRDDVESGKPARTRGQGSREN
ncbi:MAG: hypothetical protein Q9159_005018 [Coniocarpon cinnabarinum]